MPNAMQSVLATEELLVAILAQVDMRTLLLSTQRVSRHWHSIISASLPVQRALYFQPETISKAVEPGFIPHKTQNPLLKDVFPAWFENIDASMPRLPDGDEPWYHYPATAMMSYTRFEELPLYQASLKPDDNPFLRPGASWRRMLTSQPPCLSVSTNTKGASGASGLSMLKGADVGEMAWHEKGLRMGALYDATLRHAAHHLVSGFTVVWLGGGDQGYENLKHHLQWISDSTPLQAERIVRELWEQRPDMVVQMLWFEGSPGSAVEPDKDVIEFWEMCGTKLLNPEG